MRLRNDIRFLGRALSKKTEIENEILIVVLLNAIAETVDNYPDEVITVSKLLNHCHVDFKSKLEQLLTGDDPLDIWPESRNQFLTSPYEELGHVKFSKADRDSAFFWFEYKNIVYKVVCQHNPKGPDNRSYGLVKIMYDNID
ncbi:MAG: hypothetical protein N0C84_01050 [Candidatus Thiodiazotropha taylori]|uniref:Uncharacterized protein n=1 Tax=Candidatus Thiodiazotropha taylori TaxID=2792791 RepID=A0A9E4K9K4_9GAMM|nr:hypothetical protein [Candidatus Thiodiazotropha taylori]MCW4255033.1 hypothetical protein [Candidatus Thiodiazotropha taylori]